MSWRSPLASLVAVTSPTATLLLLLALVFGSVFFVSLVLMRSLLVRGDIKRRANASDATGPIHPRSLRPQDAIRASDMLTRVGKFLAPTDAESYSQARKEMVKAGFFSPTAVPAYHAARLIIGFGLPFLVLAVIGFVPLGLSATGVTVVVAILSALGFIGPSFYLRHRQKKMKAQYRSGFPDFMDLLVVCVESGLSLQPSIDRISREIAPTTPQFAANLHLVCLELRAGSSLSDALDALTQRLDIDEALSLASLLKQSEELGTSLSAALRVYSDEMRDKRLMRAEAMAHALPVKITFPVGFCIFPVILVILFLPLVIRIKQVLAY
jgi:tight adherence protein C